MKRFICILLIILFVLSSCKKADSSDEQAFNRPDDEKQTVADAASQPESNNEQQTENDSEQQTENDSEQQPTVDIVVEESSSYVENEQTKTVPHFKITLVTDDVAYASDGSYATELRNILENGEYTHKHCGCTYGCRVYFDGDATCLYTIFICKPLQAVHINSKDGEYRPDVETSLKIIELIPDLCTYNSEIRDEDEHFIDRYELPSFIKVNPDSYYTVLTEKNSGAKTRAQFTSKKLTSLLNQAKFDKTREQSGLGNNLTTKVDIVCDGYTAISGNLDCDQPFLLKNKMYAVLSEDLAKQILEEVQKHKAYGHPITVECYRDIFSYSGYTFDNPDSEALISLLASLEFDTPACHCTPDIKATDYQIVFERDSNNAHVKYGDLMCTLTKKERDKLTDILLRQLTSQNFSVSAQIDYFSLYDKLEMTVTKDGKTVNADKDSMEQLGHIFDIASYGGEKCECGEKYAVINTIYGEYSFCTCESPKIASSCGTKRIDANTLERLLEVIDLLFK